MITTDQSNIVESLEELPRLDGSKRLFLDVETASFDDKRGGLRPYSGDRVCGIAVTADDIKQSWYVPLRHRREKWNLPVEPVMQWTKGLVTTCKDWVNHNVKFDAHFLAVDGAEFGRDVRLVDTATLAKLIDSDRMNHKLKPLCRDWVGMEMEEDHEVQRYLKGAKTKDYASVPADILGRYACMDTLGNRRLYDYLLTKKPEDCEPAWTNEILMTPVLYDIERTGMLIDVTLCKIELAKSLMRIIQIGDRIKEMLGVEIVDSSQCTYDIMVNQLGLPVISFNKDSGNPSFDFDTMVIYQGHPKVVTDPRAMEVVQLILDFRQETHFKGLFAESLLEKRDLHGRVHPSYNQMVRTGRMSCSDPNAQQFSKRAKRLVVPGKGRGFICSDASQIEFRLIVHYIKDEAAIKAFNEDPNTDFHQWVNELCEMGDRDPAKTMNFSMAFGAGKRKVKSQLAANKHVMKTVMAEVESLVERKLIEPDERVDRYGALVEARADDIYATYHERLPGIQLTSNKAAALCRKRGWIRNAYGRRRHLPHNRAHIAFNSLNQGCAGDVYKDRMVAFAPRYNSWTRDHDIHLLANVHDEILNDGPDEVMKDPATIKYIDEVLEDTAVKFRVPIKWKSKYSNVNWAEAKP